MNFRWLGVLGVCLSAASAVGQVDLTFKIQLHADRKVFLERTPQDGRKLMNYALDRMESAKVEIRLKASGRFWLSFDDGYAVDRFELGGQWARDSRQMVLDVALSQGRTKRFVLASDGNGGFSMDQMMGVPKGISAKFIPKTS